MSKIITDDIHYNNIASIIQLRLGTDTKYTPAEMPDGVQAVYAKGFEEGEAIGIEVGKEVQYSEFWDAMQPVNANTGAVLTAGSGSFTGPQWDDNTFKPKRDVILNVGWNGGCFNYITVTDLTAAFERTGTKLDTSKVTSSAGLFQNAKVERIPFLDLSNCTTIGTLCYACNKLETIDGIKVSTKLTSFTNSLNTASLKNLTITDDSVIACDAPVFKYNVALSKASIISIINALSDTATDKTLSLSLTAVNKAFETSEGANDGSTSNEWNNLKNTKTKWRIDLV